MALHVITVMLSTQSMALHVITVMLSTQAMALHLIKEHHFSD
jgi:hypothetical protein